MSRNRLDNSTINFVNEDKSVSSFKPSDTKRNWFLTVFEGAECYKRVPETCEHLLDGFNECYNWAYILHDKDTMSKKDFENLPLECQKNYEILKDCERTEQKWAYKRPHYHILLCFTNGKSFNRLCYSTNKKIGFDGAKVMPCFSIGGTFAYLTHKTKEAIRHAKYQYDDREVVSNNIAFFTTQTVRTVVFENFDPALIPYYIFCQRDKMRNLNDFWIRFSLPSVMRYHNSIQSCFNLRDFLDKECQGRYFVSYRNGSYYFQDFDEVASLSNTYSVKFDDFGLSDLGRVYYSNLLKFGKDSEITTLTSFESFLCRKSFPDLALSVDDLLPEVKLSENNLVGDIMAEFKGNLEIESNCI